MRVVVSLAHFSGLSGPAGVEVLRREPDGGSRGWRKVTGLFARSVRLAVRLRGADRVVLVTAGLELFVLAALLPAGTLVAVDWLVPTSRRLDVRWPLSRVRRFVVIRRSDVDTLGRRFRVPAQRCSFVRFPAAGPRLADVGDDGYVYSAGWAHRDWPTLLAALDGSGVEALLSMPERPAELPAGVRAVSQLPPSQGREWMVRSRCVVLAFVDTDLPSGPLVLLDAMSHGKPVVVSDVGGSRDYVRHDVDALVVPPGDVDALRAALQRVASDADLRTRLGTAARRSASRLTEEAFWADVLAHADAAPPAAAVDLRTADVAHDV